MNTATKRGPTLRRHKRSGRGYAKFNGRQVWFGPYDHRDTHAEFAAFKARWEATGRVLPDDVGAGDGASFTVDTLADDYVAHLRRRHDARWLAGSPTA